jgi:hypothetical protein
MQITRMPLNGMMAISVPSTSVRIRMQPVYGHLTCGRFTLSNAKDPIDQQPLHDCVRRPARRGAWNEDDSGDVAPRWTIAKGYLYMPRGLTLDPKKKTVIVSDKYMNSGDDVLAARALRASGRPPRNRTGSPVTGSWQEDERP